MITPNSKCIDRLLQRLAMGLLAFTALGFAIDLQCARARVWRATISAPQVAPPTLPLPTTSEEIPSPPATLYREPGGIVWDRLSRTYKRAPITSADRTWEIILVKPVPRRFPLICRGFGRHGALLWAHLENRDSGEWMTVREGDGLPAGLGQVGSIVTFGGAMEPVVEVLSSDGERLLLGANPTPLPPKHFILVTSSGEQSPALEIGQSWQFRDSTIALNQLTDCGLASVSVDTGPHQRSLLIPLPPNPSPDP